MTFTLHPDLIRDGVPMGDFPLCRVLLINDAAYPWFVLVPMIDGLRDTIDMNANDHATLWEESRTFSQAIMTAFAGEKLNVAALGNMTPQLHIHHIVRYAADAAWPGPIWGKQPLTPYDEDGIKAVSAKLLAASIEGFTPK